MEFLRKNPLFLSTFLVFFGYLFSCSMMTYQPLSQYALAMLSPFTWIFIASLILISLISGFLKYLIKKQCSFLLQIGEYIMLPLTSFAFIQQFWTFKQEITENKTEYWHFLVFTLIILCILVLIILKINFLNQIFIGEKNKDILQLSKVSRFSRIAKICISCIGSFFLSQDQYPFLLAILNVLQFLIIVSSTTFIETKVEQALLLANLNNVLSIIFYFLPIQREAFWTILPEILLIFLYFYLPYPLQEVLQFRYILEFRKFELNKNDFQHKNSKKIVIILLQCFSQLYSFAEQQKLIEIPESKSQYSQNFIFEFKKAYQLALLFYLENKKIFQNFTLKNRIKANKSSNQHKNLQEILILKYQQIFKKTSNIHEIIQDKVLFLNFVAFSMDMLEEQDQKKSQWNYSNEFLLSFTSDFNQNFIIKKLLLHQIRLSQIEQSIFYKARNQQLYSYIKNYQVFYEMNAADTERYILFEQQLKDLKVVLADAAAMQLKFVQKVNSPSVQILEYEKYLIQRYKKKEEILTTFNKRFKNPYYPYFDEFSFLFLMYATIYCKNVSRCIEFIGEKFMKKIKSITLEQKKTIDRPILVCCGLETKRKKLGDIILGNTLFRKSFGFSQAKSSLITKKVCDLISNSQQKANHLNLMIESSKFSQNEVKRLKHTEYECLLKINLESHKIDLFKRFSVTTNVLQSYETSLMYLCSFEQKGSEVYMPEHDYANLHMKEPSRKFFAANGQKISHSQLGTEITYVTVSQKQLWEIGAASTSCVEIEHTNYSVEICHGTSILVGRSWNDEDQKFIKIQQILWNREASSDKNFLKYVFISLVILIVGIGCCLGSFYCSFQKAADTTAAVNEFSHLMIGTQGCEIRTTFALYLLRKVQAGHLNRSICSSFDINDLEAFFRSKSSGCINSRINDYFVNFYEKQLFDIIPVFDTHFIEAIEMESSFPIDYSNYIMDVSTTAVQYLESNLSQLQGYELQLFNKFINEHSNVDPSSFSYKFINLVSRRIQNFLITFNLWYNSIVSLTYAAMNICFIVFIVYAFVTLVEYMKYPKLLSKMQPGYVNQRKQQMSFIVDEIEKTYNYSFKKIHYIANDEIKIQAVSMNKVEEIQVPLYDFEKLAHKNEKKQVQDGNNAHSSIICDVIQSKKYKLCTLLCCYFIILSVITLIANTNQKIIQNNFLISKIVASGAITKETKLSMNFIFWMAYLNETELRSREENVKYLEQVNQYLKKNEFFMLLYSRLNKQILNEAVYIDTCSILDKYYPGSITFQNCVKNLGDMSSYTTAQLMSIITKQEFDSWSELYAVNESKESANAICKNMIITLNQLTPAIMATMNSTAINLNKQNYQMLQYFQVSLYIAVVVCIVVSFIIFFQTYHTLTQYISLQVFAMDNPKNLYKNVNFKPYLNRLYYKYSVN